MEDILKRVEEKTQLFNTRQKEVIVIVAMVMVMVVVVVMLMINVRKIFFAIICFYFVLSLFFCFAYPALKKNRKKKPDRRRLKVERKKAK